MAWMICTMNSYPFQSPVKIIVLQKQLYKFLNKFYYSGYFATLRKDFLNLNDYL